MRPQLLTLHWQIREAKTKKSPIQWGSEYWTRLVFNVQTCSIMELLGMAQAYPSMMQFWLLIG